MSYAADECCSRVPQHTLAHFRLTIAIERALGHDHGVTMGHGFFECLRLECEVVSCSKINRIPVSRHG